MKKLFVRYIFFTVLTGLTETVYATGYDDISALNILLKLLFYIGVFIVVIIVTLYGTKLIAKNYKGYGNSKYIKLLDTLSIPGGIKIVIIKVSKKIYILSLSPNDTKVIDTINEDEFSNEDFNSYLDKYTNKKDNKINLSIKKIIEKRNFSKDKEEKENEN